MIEIRRYTDGIEIEGHAQYAPHDQDIVCAAISTLAQTLIQSIEDLTTDPIEYAIQSGMIEIKHRNLSEASRLLIDSFFVGCSMTAEAYPENVQIRPGVERR